MFLTETTNPEMVTIDWNELINVLINWCMTTGIKLVLGLLVLFILFKVVNGTTRKLYKSLQKKHVD